MDNERNRSSGDIEPVTSDFSHDPRYDEVFTHESPMVTILGAEHKHKILETIQKLKNALINPETDPEELRQLWLDYSKKFEVLAEQTYDDETYIKFQIAAIVHKAYIFRDTGNPLRHAEELDIAEMYARNAGFTAPSLVLGFEIDAVIASLEPSPELLILQLRGAITDLNREMLRDIWLDEQDFDDLIDRIRKMLKNDKKDPEEILNNLDVEKYRPKF